MHDMSLRRRHSRPRHGVQAHLAAVRAELAAKRQAAKPADCLSEPAIGLAVMPGLGPSVVAMFDMAGIRTLGDLLEADANDLSQELGLVGAVLDLDDLRAVAAELVSGHASRT